MAGVNVKPARRSGAGATARRAGNKKRRITFRTAKEKTAGGKVVALGTGKVNEEGRRWISREERDKVLISKYGGPKSKSTGKLS